MSREEIIEMLKSIGVTPTARRPVSFVGFVTVFQLFAELVAKKEREEFIHEPASTTTQAKGNQC